MSKIANIFAFAVVASLAIAGQAVAQADLKSSAPADKAVVKAAPAELDLFFSEELNLEFTGIKVLGPDNKEVKLGGAMLMNGDTMLMMSVSDTLGPGTYTVQWHALSADGHKTEGKYSFTVKP